MDTGALIGGTLMGIVLFYFFPILILGFLIDESSIRRLVVIYQLFRYIPILNLIVVLLMIVGTLCYVLYLLMIIVGNTPKSLYRYHSKVYAEFRKEFVGDNDNDTKELSLHEKRKRKIQNITKKWYQW
jgi:hypothetical protein